MDEKDSHQLIEDEFEEFVEQSELLLNEFTLPGQAILV